MSRMPGTPKARPAKIWKEFAITEMLAHDAVAGEIFRRLRCESSQKDFADKALLSQSTLSRFENGETSPDLYELRRIAGAVHRSATEVITMVDKAFDLATDIARKVNRATKGNFWDGVPLNTVASLAALGVSALAEAEPGVFNPIKARSIGKPDRRKSRPRRQDDVTKKRIGRSHE